MEIPAQFAEICGQFDADIHLRCSSIEEMVRIALYPVGREQAAVARSFLDELLSGRYDEDELQDIWYRTHADIYFPKPEELMAVLTTMRTMLAAKLSSTENGRPEGRHVPVPEKD